MAQVDIQAGPFRVVSLMSREAVDELGLEVGSVAVAVIKSTTVVVERAVARDARRGHVGVAMCARRCSRRPWRGVCGRAGCWRAADPDASGGSGDGGTGSVTVFAAASLTESFTAARRGLRGRPPRQRR